MSEEKKDVVALGVGGARTTTSRSGRKVVRDEKGRIVRTRANREARLAFLRDVKKPALQARTKKVNKQIKDLEKGLADGIYPEEV